MSDFGRSRMLHVAVCDDDKNLLSYLEEKIESWAEAAGEACSVELYQSAEAFLFAWEEKKDVDVLLLDIEMPGIDGIELARSLRHKGERISIIFVTGNPEFALEGYELEAVSYLVKPVKEELLRAALDRAQKQRKNRPVLLAALSGGAIERIYVSDICCLESEGHDTVIWKRGGERIICKMGIQQLEQELSGLSEAFFKPHRSFFIHLEWVEKIGKKDVYLDGQICVPIARGRWEALNQAYLAYYRKRAYNS